MQQKDPIVRILFVLFIFCYLLAAIAEYVFAQVTKAITRQVIDSFGFEDSRLKTGLKTLI